jgi:hypothetical protein
VIRRKREKNMSIYEYYVEYIDDCDFHLCKAKGIIFGEKISDVASIIESYYGCAIESIAINTVAFDETGIFEGYVAKKEKDENGH